MLKCLEVTTTRSLDHWQVGRGGGGGGGGLLGGIFGRVMSCAFPSPLIFSALRLISTTVLIFQGK